MLRAERPTTTCVHIAIVAAISLVAGCGQGGVPRLRVYGTVTHSGKPVPAGKIRFEPNASKGGSGPIGFAQIINGVFDCGRGAGKGPLQGPVRVMVTGFVSGERFAPELFPRYVFEAELSKESRELAIEVP